MHEVRVFDFDPSDPGELFGDASEPQVNTGILLAKNIAHPNSGLGAGHVLVAELGVKRQ
ncbi:hypothetical protein NCS56_01532700 [Fusarium sp. Ph1]|nr:hypothetical protein NCS56_01532700 [Fusarium sp. Ph1]